MHPRTQIRQTIASMLDGATSAGSEVYTNRTRRFRVENLPALVIYDVGEQVQLYNESPREYRRQMQLAVDLYVEDASPESGQPIDEILDDLADEVEQKLYNDTTAQDNLDDLRLQEVSDVMVSDDQRQQLGMVTLTWQATYYQEAPEIEASTLNDLQSTHTDWQIDEDDEIEAEDNVSL
jgi:hypothetical protein